VPTASPLEKIRKNGMLLKGISSECQVKQIMLLFFFIIMLNGLNIVKVSG
jgi:hypothetical protein